MKTIIVRNINATVDAVRPKPKEQYRKKVESIILDVQKRKDKALKEYEKKFSGAKPRSFRVSRSEIKDAYSKVTKEQIAAIKLAKKINQQRERYSSGGVGANYHPQDTEELDTATIMKILPHREPFLFVDKIISLEKGKRAKGVKNVTINDYFFRGHFPGKPVMPGVLIIEAMAQVGGIMMLSPEENRGKLAYFLAANNIKFRKTVLPGDQLILDVEAGRIKSKTGQVHAKAFVDGKVVAEADLMFALVES